MNPNPILNTDGYKPSHPFQYVDGLEHLFAHMLSRGGPWDETLVFGFQPILREVFGQRVTHRHVTDAAKLLKPYGVPFHEAGWSHIVDKHGGALPMLVRALPEGSIVPTRVPLLTAINTDPKVGWLTGHLETPLLRAWYPITVATLDWHIRQTIKRYLEETADDPEAELPFKLHDFGARGVSSYQSAELGGMAHLVNFLGTDNLPALLAMQQHYDAEVAGFSIPAAEHSTITSWGREREAAAYENMLDKFPGPVAIVSDSYDLYDAIARLWGGTLKQKVLDHEGTVIIRPDSGDPVQTVMVTLALLRVLFGYTVNSKGYTVLNKVRVLQGDGVNEQSIRTILQKMKEGGFSASNISFGMGGALLQGVNRDTLKFKYATSAERVNGEWRDMSKDPKTDPGKRSMGGLLDVVYETGYSVRRMSPDDALDPGFTLDPNACYSSLRTVYHNGEFHNEINLDQVRQRMQAHEKALAIKEAT